MKCLYCSAKLERKNYRIGANDVLSMCPQDTFLIGITHTHVGMKNRQITFLSSTINIDNINYFVFISKLENVFALYYDAGNLPDFVNGLILEMPFQSIRSLKQIPPLIQRYLNLKSFS